MVSLFPFNGLRGIAKKNVGKRWEKGDLMMYTRSMKYTKKNYLRFCVQSHESVSIARNSVADPIAFL